MSAMSCYSDEIREKVEAIWNNPNILDEFRSCLHIVFIPENCKVNITPVVYPLPEPTDELKKDFDKYIPGDMKESEEVWSDLIVLQRFCSPFLFTPQNAEANISKNFPPCSIQPTPKMLPNNGDIHNDEESKMEVEEEENKSCLSWTTL